MLDTVAVNTFWSHHRRLILVSGFSTMARNHFSFAQVFHSIFQKHLQRGDQLPMPGEMDG